MVVIGRSDGQLGNRLMVSAHALAHALSKKESFIDLGLGSYSIYYNSLLLLKRNQVAIISPHFISKYLKLISVKTLFQLNTYFKFMDYYKIGWVHTEILSLKRERKKILLLEGEGFRDTLSVKQNKEYIKYLMTPKLSYLRKLKGIKYLLDSEYDLIIGVHIRRGDYKNWSDGKYYFDDSVYIEAIKQANSLLGKGEKTVFVICSDEKINSNSFDEYNTFLSDADLITDLHLLASCHYLIGPPSTFSGWASFYGDVPLYTIKSSVFKLSLSNFEVYNL